TGLEPRDVGPGEKADVRMLEGGIHAEYLHVRLAVDETRVTIAGTAADAGALARRGLVEADPQRHVERPEPESREVVAEPLHARVMADRRVRVRRAGWWVRGVLAALAVHVVKLLGLRVVGLKVLVADRPGGRDAAPVLELVEVLPAQPEERRPVELGVAADPVVRVRMEVRALGGPPGLRRR